MELPVTGLSREIVTTIMQGLVYRGLGSQEREGRGIREAKLSREDKLAMEVKLVREHKSSRMAVFPAGSMDDVKKSPTAPISTPCRIFPYFN